MPNLQIRTNTERVQMNFFLQLSQKPCFMGSVYMYKLLDGAILQSTHNICFYGKSTNHLNYNPFSGAFPSIYTTIEEDISMKDTQGIIKSNDFLSYL